MGVFTTIGWLMRGAVVYVLYWAFGYIVAGCIFTPRPVPLLILLLVTAGAVPVTVASVRKEYKMVKQGRAHELEREMQEAMEKHRKRVNEEQEDWMWNPLNRFGYWPSRRSR